MKRSQINNAVKHAIKMLENNNMRLPAFAYWTPDEWEKRRADIENIKAIGLGWDVTDFGSGDFTKQGAVLFTVRNGCIENQKYGTPYAEKLIFMLHETEQEIPLHFHRVKTEDIINRGGGVLMIELYNSLKKDSIDTENDIHVKMDGFNRTFPAGAIVEIEKGCSITLQHRLYHRFWAKKGAGDLVVGEVSSINDDKTDNVFNEPKQRFSNIEEDEPAAALLCNEY